MTEEETIAQKLEVQKISEEIKELRRWRHETAQKPQADMLKASLLEQSLTILKEKMDSNTTITEKILVALNGDEERPGIRGRLQHVEQIAETVHRLVETVDGTSQTPGHTTRIDRLDRTVSIYTRVTWAVGGAIITALVGTIITFLTKH